MKVDKSFISRGCNDQLYSFRVSQCCDSKEPYVAYASGSDIVVVDYHSSCVCSILQYHKVDVNCLSLVPELSNGYNYSLIQRENEIVSCDCNGDVAFWRVNNSDWALYQVISIGELIENVSCRSIDDHGSLVIVTTDKRSLYFFYKSSSDEEWKQIYCGTSPHPDIYYTAIEILPVQSPIPFILIFLAGTDNQIYVHSFDIETGALTLLCNLSGSENWITSLRIHRCFNEDNAEVAWHLLSSGQDGRCRIWKLFPGTVDVTRSQKCFSVRSQPFSLVLESVIEVSQTIVSSIEPHPIVVHDSHFYQPFALLVSSLDASVKVFVPEDIEAGGPFSSVVTLQPHLIGSQGFHGAFWQLMSDHREIFAYGYHGVMFRWKEKSGVEMEDSEDRSNLYRFAPFVLQPFVSGHFGAAKAHFSRYGNLILSSSLDRTVRLWGREFGEPRWKEIGRPVVHGYQVNDVAWMKDHRCMDGLTCSNTEIGRLVTINDEKKCRVYANTYLNLFVLNELVDTSDSNPIKHSNIDQLNDTFYWSSYSPELGLSNKGIPLDQAQSTLRKFHLELIPESDKPEEIDIRREENQEEEEGDAMMLMANDGELEMLVSLDVLQVVTNRGSNNLNESRLCKGTLFVETSFLYNAYTTHNFAHLHYDAEDDLLITTTTGTQEEESVITVWDNSGSSQDGALKRLQYLAGHRTTVVATCFFSVGAMRFLVSAGKDRQLRIWKLNPERKFESFVALPKAHGRIIWSCDVVFTSDTKAWLVSASRDGLVKVWEFIAESGNLKECASLEVGESVTAVSVSKMIRDARAILAYGTENGLMGFATVSRNDDVISLEKGEETQLGKQINTIEWLPIEKQEGTARTFEEYYEKSHGNCVVGCQNGGIYLFKVYLIVC